MLTIRHDLVDAIVAHARRDHPDEACGVLAGPAGCGSSGAVHRDGNAERSPTFYRFDSRSSYGYGGRWTIGTRSRW